MARQWAVPSLRIWLCEVIRDLQLVRRALLQVYAYEEDLATALPHAFRNNNDQPNAVYAQNIERGNAQYVQFCVPCHGIAAKGDGPLAQSFNPPPTDLTRLADRNGGLFPLVKVYDAIDGTTVTAHDGRDMPLPGMVFDPIIALMEYLIALEGNSVDSRT
jgi:mono/diheme cytochrome c family protein